MKKRLLLALAVAGCLTAGAQTMNVCVGDVVYQIPASQAGDMVYSGGTSVTIMGKTFSTSEISSIYVDNTAVTDNTVTVTYDGTSAKVYIAGNIAQYMDATVSGAHVTVKQGDGIGDATGKVAYTLSGSSTDGEFYMTGNYKMDMTLNGLTLTNPNGAAIDIENGKKVNVTVKKNTENTLTDGTGGSQKACFVIKGHAEFKGQGTLNVYGNTAHAIKTSDEMMVKNCTLNVKKAVKDGLHANAFFQQVSGVIDISNVGDDAIQVELDGTEPTAILDGHEDEDTGNLYIDGGTLTATVTAIAAKCLKSDYAVIITGGTLSLTAAGEIDLTGTDSSGNIDPSYTAAIKGNDVTVSGGDITLTVTGTAGRGISADNTLTTNGGTILINNSGPGKYYSNDTYTAKGLKALNMALNAGDITINMTGTGGKGILVGDGTKTTSSGGWGGPGGPGGGTTYTNITGSYTQGLEDGTGPRLTVNTTGSAVNSDGSAKGIKAICAVTIYGGETVVTTKTSGAEGLESKTGIDIRGGKHYFRCYDDCINSAGKILFNGGVTVCHSNGNDAVDSNAGTTGAITIGDGVVFAYTTRGASEEGFDCDNNSYIQITGNGIAISAGASQGGGGGWGPGGGGWGPGGGSSSGNTISNAAQGYAFVTSTINYQPNRYYTLADAIGNNLVTYSFEASCSSTLALFTAKGMVRNSTYTVKSDTTEPTDATTSWHGLYLGSTAAGTTQVTSFTAQ